MKALSYKVHDTGSVLFPYAVVDPTGWLVTFTATRWGARRAIAKDIASKERPPIVAGYWHGPVVEETYVEETA